ncbi:MAG: hypothetical protein ACRBCI_12560 [Cellvibrionaceae bacterium]
MDKVSFFPVGNGDTVLFEVEGNTVMTDIHYRAKTEDESEDDYYPLREDIKEACKTSDGYFLDCFVSTHPDKDHVLGFGTVFHTGDPSDYKPDDETILIKEIWVSKYGSDPNYETEESKALIDEIKRRKKLSGTADDNIDGNRIKIFSLDDEDQVEGEVNDSLRWRLLAPNDSEADIEDSGDETSPNSCNDSSLVIRWEYTKNNKKEYILLGGDAGYKIWERIRNDFSDQDLKWSVLLAPHHCSRCSLQFKNDDGVYEDSEDAISALSNINGKGFVVSSSKKVKKDQDRPPAWEAKQKYLNILEESHENGHKDRFLNPQTYGDKEKPKPVVFRLSENGLVLDKASKSENKSSNKYSAAVTVPSTYGSQ